MQVNEQRVALVTGGNRGIGKAIVSQLAEKGIKVLLACRDIEQGMEAARHIQGDVKVVQLELSEPKVLARQLKQIDAKYPRIDILVNNAAVLEERGFSSLSSADLAYSMQVNALSAYELIQFFGNRMTANGYGRIVNISSGWGAFSDGLTGPAAYSISKATLNAITKVASLSYPDFVKINAMCPGWVRTRMGGNHAPRSPSDAAQTAIWLACLEEKGPTGSFFRDKQEIAW